MSVINTVNIDKMIEREVFSEYLYSPLKRSFSSVVRITALVLRAHRKFMLQLRRRRARPDNVKLAKFSVFAIATEAASKKMCLNNDELSAALEYLYMKATAEVKRFNNPKLLKRIIVKKDGILYC